MPPPSIPMVVSTDMFPERDRFDAWRETFALKLARVDARTPDPSRFRAVMAARPLERLWVIENALSAASAMRGRAQLSDGDDDLTLIVCTGTAFESVAGDDRVTVGTGEATIVQHNLKGGLVNDHGTASLSVRLSRSHLRELTGMDDPPVLPVIAASQPMLPLLRLYLRALASERGMLAPEAAALADRQIGELVAAVLDPGSDLARSEAFGGIKAARLQAVQQVIERDLADPALTPTRVGAALGLSERYVQRLLSDAGTSFSQLVRRKRLERARRLLEARTAERRGVADIAYAVGFGDLSTFNHAFRKQFGCTPSELRRR